MRVVGRRFSAPGWVLFSLLFLLPFDQWKRDSGVFTPYQTSCATCHIDFPKAERFRKGF